MVGGTDRSWTVAAREPVRWWGSAVPLLDLKGGRTALPSPAATVPAPPPWIPSGGANVLSRQPRTVGRSPASPHRKSQGAEPGFTVPRLRALPHAAGQGFEPLQATPVAIAGTRREPMVEIPAEAADNTVERSSRPHVRAAAPPLDQARRLDVHLVDVLPPRTHAPNCAARPPATCSRWWSRLRTPSPKDTNGRRSHPWSWRVVAFVRPPRPSSRAAIAGARSGKSCAGITGSGTLGSRWSRRMWAGSWAVTSAGVEVIGVSVARDRCARYPPAGAGASTRTGGTSVPDVTRRRPAARATSPPSPRSARRRAWRVPRERSRKRSNRRRKAARTGNGPP